MGIQDVKNILNQYQILKLMIDDLDRQIKENEIRMTSIKAGKISGMPRGGVAVTFADMIADNEELESRKLRFEKISKQKKEIVQAYIDTVLSVKHNRLLTLFYIKGLSIYEIAEKENYSDRHAFRIYEEALKMVDIGLDL